MSDATAIAISGLKSEEFLINTLASDIANLNTANYKASSIAFEDTLYRPMNSAQSSLQNNSDTPQIGLGTAIHKTSKDFSQGPLKPSNHWNDLAIDGLGFFQIINAEGNVSYTRNSSFSIDTDHFLATEDGMRLTDNIQIPEDYLEIKIQKNGDVLVSLANEAEPQLIGSIKLAKFTAPESLKSLGSGLYDSTAQSGEPIVDSPGSNGMGNLLQKQIEGSNVDMVQSLMQLTLAQRIYQLNAKAVQIADQLEKITNEIRD